MVKKLAERKLVRHVPYKGVELSEAGEALALEVLRHHRLLETFLEKSLGVPWDRVHDEAEVLEHVLSEELEELIAAKLGDPTRDPHGDPIPTRDGRVEEADHVALDTLRPGQQATFVRVSDSNPEMLRYLSERGISPGDRFEVVDKQPFDGPVFARFGDSVHVLGGGLAQAMRVEPGK
jgi:DtxR family transcriptional regulator, Mn-dependent transcriptional regulator